MDAQRETLEPMKGKSWRSRLRRVLATVALGNLAWRRLGGDGSALIDVENGDAAWPPANHLIGIAHNAGDSLKATERAVRRGAEVIEIDVVSSRGRLYAGHRRQIPWLGPWLFRRPTLEQVWVASAPVAIMLDLKESSPVFLARLVAFLAEYGRDRTVIVVSGNPATLEAFQRQMPDVIRFYGASPPGRLEAFMKDEALITMVHGLNLRHERIDARVGAWTRAHGLWLIAWTVNDFACARELAEIGVDIITTDNVAILAQLRGDASAVANHEKGARHNTNPVVESTGPVREGRE